MMKSQRQQCFCRLGRVLLFMIVLLLFLAAGFDFYYDLNDDTTIKDIISGAYTGIPDGYSIQMLYPLGYLISMCYKAIPGIAWYGLFLCVCHFGVFLLIGYRLTGFSEKRWMQYSLLFLETLLFTGLLFRFLVMMQYSITSGICMAGAIFLYLTGKNGIKNQIIPVLLVMLSFLIRTELCLMMMPFLLVAGFFRMFLEQAGSKEERFLIVKRNLLIMCIACIGMISMKGLDAIYVNSSTDWKSFMAFFDARTKLYDFYGIPEYDANIDFYQSIGLSKESYALLQNYNFSLDEAIDDEILERIVDYVEKNPQSCGLYQTFGKINTKKSIKEAIWLYQYRLRSGQDGYFGVCILLAYLCLFVLYGQGNKKNCFLSYIQLCCLFLARSAVWIYLLMVNRLLDRILIPLYLGELMTLLAWLTVSVYQTNKQENGKKVSSLILTGFVLCLTVTGMYAFYVNGKSTRDEYLAREQINPRWEALMDYCKRNPDKYYLIDVYSSTSYQGVAYSEKVFQNVDNSYRNFDLCGGWLAKSPLTKEKLLKSGIRNMETELIFSDQLCFIADCNRDMQWMKDYYKQKGKTIEIEAVDIIVDEGNALFYVYEIK